MHVQSLEVVPCGLLSWIVTNDGILAPPQVGRLVQDINTLADLKGMTQGQWMRLKGVSKNKAEAIMAALAELT